MFAPVDSWTLPSHLFLVSGWSAYCPDTTDPMSCRSDINLKGDHRWDYGHPPVYAWTDITWLLDEQHVLVARSTSAITRAGSTRRATTPRGGPTARPTTGTCCPASRASGTASEPTGCRTTCARSTTTWHPPPTGASPPCRGSSPTSVTSEHPDSKSTIKTGHGLCHAAGERRHAGPGLGLHGDLPDLGRLGRVLRPRRAAAGRRQRVRAARARPRDQPVHEARLRSTTRRCRSTPTCG